ncbi:MAG: peptidase S8, partial [Myxococcota bacterium]
VTAPDGTVYWGNNGLMDGVESKPGGSADRTNNIENVFLKNPAPGTWTFEVTAHRVSVDGHTETQREDVDFGLAVLGVKRPDAGGQ